MYIYIITESTQQHRMKDFRAAFQIFPFFFAGLVSKPRCIDKKEETHFHCHAYIMNTMLLLLLFSIGSALFHITLIWTLTYVISLTLYSLIDKISNFFANSYYYSY